MRVEKIKRWLEILAYLSLVIDLLITGISLISVNYYHSAGQLLIYADYLLSAEMILVVLLFMIMIFLSHYETMLEGMLQRVGVKKGDGKKEGSAEIESRPAS